MNIKTFLPTFLILISIFFFNSVGIASAVLSFDQTFGINGKVVTSYSHDANAQNLSVLQDGSIIVVGYASNGSNFDTVVSKYNSDGSPDLTFGINGNAVNDLGNNDSFINISVQSDGKIIAGGYSQPGGNYQWTLVRLNSDGSFDTSFGNNGVVTTFDGIHSLLYDNYIQVDNKIVATGWSASNGQDDVAVVRYNNDGSLDTNFGTGGIVTTPIGGNNDRGKSIFVQPDGKIVVVGDFDAGGQDMIFLVRYLSDGTLDTTFGNNGITITQIGGYDGVADSMLQPDGKIIVAGGTNFSSIPDTFIARYSSDGTLDSSFGSGGKMLTSFSAESDYAVSITLNSDGRITIGGPEAQGGNIDYAIRRFASDGTLDTSFGINGSFVAPIGTGNDFIQSIALQNDGKILAVGNSMGVSHPDWTVVRFADTPVPSVTLIPTLTEAPTPTSLPVPTDKDQCKQDGWKNYPHLGFKNQGNCVSYVNHH